MKTQHLDSDDSQRESYLNANLNKPSQEIFMNGTMAIKAHASRIKVMTAGEEHFAGDENS